MQPYDDLLTVKQFAKFTGYNATTIVGWCNRNLKHFNIAGRFLIPKISAIEYLATRSFAFCLRNRRNTQQYSRIF